MNLYKWLFILPEQSKPQPVEEVLVEQTSHHKIRCEYVCSVFESLLAEMDNSNVHGFSIVTRHRSIAELSFSLKQINRLVQLDRQVPNTDKTKYSSNVYLRDWFINAQGNYVAYEKATEELIKNLNGFYESLEKLEKNADNSSYQSLRSMSSYVTEIDQIVQTLEFLVR